MTPTTNTKYSQRSATVSQDIPERIYRRLHERSHDEWRNYIMPTPCRIWEGCRPTRGYGHIVWSENSQQHKQLTHRAAWIETHGHIPDDLQVDHICRHRACINTEHMRLLTPSANSAANGQALQSHCKHGHLFDATNTMIKTNPDGTFRQRLCRRCHRRVMRDYYQRRKQAAGA